MANASRDENSVPTLLAASSADGVTPIAVKVNSSNHGLQVADASTGTDYGVKNAVRDQNNVPVLMAVSSTTASVGGIDYVEGVTPVEVYADTDGNLLVDSS